MTTEGKTKEGSKAKRIAELNDACRQDPRGRAGRWHMTAGFAALPAAAVAEAFAGIYSFKAFTKDNDPHGEHDFGSIEVGGRKIFWKIDYYDKALEAGSEDPSDPEQTTRVLTIMLASEY